MVNIKLFGGMPVIAGAVLAAGAALALLGSFESTAGAATTTTATTAKATQVQVVRPVHANGTPVAGYHVTTAKSVDVTCDRGASPSAVDAGVLSCSPSAMYAVSCWKSAGHTVLCLQDPLRKELVRFGYAGSLPTPVKAAHPVAQTLLLLDGNACDIRNGGAWDALKGHPDWYGTYACDKGLLYGPDGDADLGTIVSTHPWRVHLVTGTAGAHNQHIRLESVGRAYFVGTAA